MGTAPHVLSTEATDAPVIKHQTISTLQIKCWLFAPVAQINITVIGNILDKKKYILNASK